MSPVARPLATSALNHVPSAARKLSGFVDELLAACGLSLPRGERPTPQMKLELATALIASYAAIRARPQIAADWLFPALSHCGLTTRGWLHSFMTANWVTLGKRFATDAAHNANCWILPVLPHASGSIDGAHLLPPVNAMDRMG